MSHNCLSFNCNMTHLFGSHDSKKGSFCVCVWLLQCSFVGCVGVRSSVSVLFRLCLFFIFLFSTFFHILTCVSAVVHSLVYSFFLLFFSFWGVTARLFIIVQLLQQSPPLTRKANYLISYHHVTSDAWRKMLVFWDGMQKSRLTELARDCR
jgi:ABC-type transport system involved in multi-copper enzyme maturation permease subunit